ncbi:MAG: hypothetical protein N3H31_05255 [Candidatus Nezhaarchaeota archaeon]|nr:hypothetical protein [Candidatus Nezhaarchaeota archaeon]
MEVLEVVPGWLTFFDNEYAGVGGRGLERGLAVGLALSELETIVNEKGRGYTTAPEGCGIFKHPLNVVRGWRA